MTRPRSPVLHTWNRQSASSLHVHLCVPVKENLGRRHQFGKKQRTAGQQELRWLPPDRPDELIASFASKRIEQVESDFERRETHSWRQVRVLSGDDDNGVRHQGSGSRKTCGAYVQHATDADIRDAHKW